ncbi:MAG: tRNA (adenosine(37)-N6)-dimethylallyltransferase MiaA [Phycisphaerales bacterium]|nr:MAG: tRNA (adenosine(37)-N6)-dimethylallyltransferase MiaA [Phycisphaerales bacterium]
MSPKLIFIIGCTGSGKGSLGRELAQRTGSEIISIDSMKVYRRMDIGTAKPSKEIRAQIPHHLIDMVEPSENFSVAQYVALCEKAIADIHLRGKLILVVGGTPLYIKGLTEGLFEGPSANKEIRARLNAQAAQHGKASLFERLRRVDPVAAVRIHPNDIRRIVRALEVFEITGRTISELQTQWDRDRTKYDCVFIGVRREREDQNNRTNERVRRMIDAGLVDEVKSLLAEPKPLSATARKALGYAEIINHLQGRGSLADAVEMIKINTRQLAKAQRTWFKRFRNAQWIDFAPDATAAGIAEELVASRGALWSA